MSTGWRAKDAWSLSAAIVMISGLGLQAACGREPEPPARVDVDVAEATDSLHLDLPQLDPGDWIRSYAPGRSAAGYNLVLYRRRLPMIIDMNGRVVHAWPGVRAVGRARLDGEGRLAVIGTDNLIKEYDWHGVQTWSFQLPGEADLPHHDLTITADGNFLILAKDGSSHADYLLEVDREGRHVWRWRAADHRAAFPGWNEESTDPTHCNSVRELPPNRWFDGGDDRFRPGNILVSARNLNTVFIIDKQTGEVVWKYSKGLDRQHEASMVEAGGPGEGAILLFNNGLENHFHYRSSLVQAIDPQREEVIWEYGSRFFFSSVGGTAQALPGGNVAVTSSRGGRVFEITPEGDIVWEWVPPYLPIRAERLRPHHCPQLAGIEPEEAIPVAPARGRPYIDTELYRFAIEAETRSVEVAGEKRELTPVNTDCRVLLMPPDARLRAGFGILADPAGPAVAEGRFRLDVRQSGVNQRLVDLTLGGSGDSWTRLPEIALDDNAYQRVRMCVSASALTGGEASSARLVWGSPVIESAVLRPTDELPARRLTEQERVLREQQLRALGYAD